MQSRAAARLPCPVGGSLEIGRLGGRAVEAPGADIARVAGAGDRGLDLRPLHGRHDQAVAATLPLARGLS